MSEDGKKLAFVAFCIESFKNAKGLDGKSAAALFARFGADESTKLWHYSPEQLYVLFAA